jgi:hypothetical protein
MFLSVSSLVGTAAATSSCRPSGRVGLVRSKMAHCVDFTSDLANSEQALERPRSYRFTRLKYMDTTFATNSTRGAFSPRHDTYHGC